MKANDLRIGNYYNQFGNIHQVSWNTIGELEHAPIDQLWCKPITLTEEWLLKFGFEKFTKASYSTGNKVVFYVFRLGALAYNSIQDNWWFGNLLLEHPPKYVHQLQNLYFALTGEELTLIEKP